MVRCRDVIVPNAVRGVEEVVAIHTITKDGSVRSKDTIVPVVVPKSKKSGQSSKRKANAQPRAEESQPPAYVTDIIDNAKGDPYCDEQMNTFPNLNPAVEDDQPQTTVCLHLEIIHMYIHMVQIPMEQWLQFRSQYLHTLLEMDAKPVSDTCSVCYKPACIKCPDCFGSPSYCRACIPYAHMHSPFHHPLLWTATHYTQVSLQSLGFALCLGHAGVPCPSTVEVCAYDIYIKMIVLMII